MKYVTTVILMLQKEETEAQESWLSSVQLLSRVRLFATPRTAARQAPLSFTIMGIWLHHLLRVADAGYCTTL